MGVETGQITFNETQYTVIDVADNTTTIVAAGGGIALLFGIYVNTVLSAHTLPFLDGNTTVVTLPASAAAGSMYNFPGIKFSTSFICDPNDAGSGVITVAWRPLAP